jgi:glucosamine-6-phosphate deaminase
LLVVVGAWHEWDLHEIDMAVPLSPDEVLKRQAILFHQSQRESCDVPIVTQENFGYDTEDRNKYCQIIR